MYRPKLACCNFIPEPRRLREFALDHGFDGVDWSFTEDNLPRTPDDAAALADVIRGLGPLEVRYHDARKRTDPGHVDEQKATAALAALETVCGLAARLGGRVLTVHVGLGRDSTDRLSWDRTVAGLADLVRFADRLGIRLCLENLAWGWTGRPNLFEKLVRLTGAWVTLDVGHAQVSPAVETNHFDLTDFLEPHRNRILNAHIYHTETEDHHNPPDRVADLRDRLNLLLRLPRCDWWVLELREEAPLIQTLHVVRDYLRVKFNGDDGPMAR